MTVTVVMLRLRYGYGTVTLRVGSLVTLRYAPPIGAYVRNSRNVPGRTDELGQRRHRFLLRSHDCGLACCRLVPFVWSAWSFVLAVVLVPPRLIRASCRYSFLLLSHVSNDRLYFISLLDSICKKSQ